MSSLETLKRSLKSWENAFYNQYQRKPCKADIKAEPTIETKYKEYKHLKLASLSLPSAESSSYKHCAQSSHHKSSKERSSRHSHIHEHEKIKDQGTRTFNQSGTLYNAKTALLTPAKSSPNRTLNDSNFMASPIKQVAEIGPTPQLNGRLLGIFETIEASLGNSGDGDARQPETPLKRTPTKDIAGSPNLNKIIITPSIKRKLDFGEIHSDDEEENYGEPIIKQTKNLAKKSKIQDIKPKSSNSNTETKHSGNQFRQPSQETFVTLKKYATPTENRINKRIIVSPSASTATRTPLHQSLILSPTKIKTPSATFERTFQNIQSNNVESTPLYLSQGATVLLKPVINAISPSKKATTIKCNNYYDVNTNGCANGYKQVDNNNDYETINNIVGNTTPTKTTTGSSEFASPSVLKSEKRLSSLVSTLSSASLVPSTSNATISTTIDSVARQSRSSKSIRRKTLSEIFNEVQEIKKDLQSSAECEEVRMQIEMDRKEQQLLLEVEQQEAKEFINSKYNHNRYCLSEGNSEFLESDRVDLVGEMGRAVNGFEYDLDELSDIGEYGTKPGRNSNKGNSNDNDGNGYVTNENHKTAYWLKKKRPKRQTRRVKIRGRESLEEEKIIDEGEVKVMIQALQDNQIGKGHNNNISNADRKGEKLGEENDELDEEEEIDDFDEQQEYVSDSGDEYDDDDVQAIIRASHNEKAGIAINDSGKDGKAKTRPRINNNFKRYKLKRGNSRFKRRW